MPADTHGPFPFGAVRDLLGITRALYRATRDSERQARLESIGRSLNQALELARRCGPGTLGRRAAWDWGERAAAELGQLVADGATVEPLVRAAATRLRRR
jgi:hypothetical protein